MHTRALPLIPCLLLAAACGGGGNNDTTTIGESTTFPETSSDDDPSNSSDNDPTTGGGTTTSASGTTTSGTTGPGDTTDVTTGPPVTTTTGPGPMACMASAECDSGICWADYNPNTMMPDEFLCQDVCVDSMGGGNAEDVWCIDVGSCCDPDATCNEMGYCIGGGGDTTTTGDTDTDTGTGTGTGTDTDTDTGTGTGTGTGTDTDTDTGGVLPLIDISGLAVFANCQPPVPSDPVTAGWTLTVDNTTGDLPVTATLTKATLTYGPGMGEFVQGVDVTPTMVGPVAAMMKSMAMMKKTAALDNLPNDCQRCNKPVKLDLTFDVGGMMIPASAEVMMGCAF